MPGKRSVERDEAQVLDKALAEQQTVKRIARRRLRLSRRHCMAMIDDEKRQAKGFEIAWHLVKWAKERKLSKPCLNGDLPQARGAGK